LTVVLISRGSMSGGETIAACLSRTGAFTCITRENLVSAVNEYGQLAARLTEEIASAARDYDRFTQLRRPYRIFMKRALLEYARQGDLAYFGYSGHLLLDRARHLVRVRLTAPLEVRVRLTMERLECCEEEARAYIRRADEERTRWARFMYGTDIRDPGHYDVCLNMERFSPGGVCRLLQDLVGHEELQPSRESLQQVENSRVATEVLVALLLRPETYPLEIGATFQAGTAFLEGPYLDADDQDRVERVARSVPEVRDVRYEPGYAPSFLLS
jgi:cytidylate kinase